MRNRTLAIGAAIVVVAALLGILWGRTLGTPDPGPAAASEGSFVGVVQAQWPDFDARRSVDYGVKACLALDREGTTRYGATREVATLDGRVDRAPLVVEAAIVNFCPEHLAAR